MRNPNPDPSQPETSLAVGNWKGPPETAEANAGAGDTNGSLPRPPTVGLKPDGLAADDEDAAVVLDEDDSAPDTLEPDEAAESCYAEKSRTGKVVQFAMEWQPN